MRIAKFFLEVGIFLSKDLKKFGALPQQSDLLRIEAPDY